MQHNATPPAAIHPLPSFSPAPPKLPPAAAEAQDPVPATAGGAWSLCFGPPATATQHPLHLHNRQRLPPVPVLTLEAAWPLWVMLLAHEKQNPQPLHNHPRLLPLPIPTLWAALPLWVGPLTTVKLNQLQLRHFPPVPLPTTLDTEPPATVKRHQRHVRYQRHLPPVPMPTLDTEVRLKTPLGKVEDCVWRLDPSLSEGGS